ncbi:tryptophan synthase subunit alpha [Flocculibacter collagenilyticus]|uniref:tryptophan synthase subunit alpha n=1 Tax=Flocculibacter collagenilyticus TaxID=2744479 RepID=UPI0018F488AC|nr:tryptophan synthase subunit alpha [Flocculibacter collagenilyticus]
MNTRYDAMFHHLREQKQGAFVPFVTIGDPNLSTSLRIIKTLIDNGADALELGIPFSDPVADGPTIQAANIRALDAGVTPSDCFELLREIRLYAPNMPIGLLLYSNLVMAKGIDNFYALMNEISVDSVLVADVPLRECKPFRQAAVKYNVAPIFIATPNASDDRLRELASYGRGYTYLLSRAGVTGTETVAQMPAQGAIKKLLNYHAAPPLLGFGISQPEHVKEAIANGAAGAISGSAVVNIIEQHLDDESSMLKQLGEFIENMKQATK